MLFATPEASNQFLNYLIQKNKVYMVTISNYNRQKILMLDLITNGNLINLIDL